MTIEQQQAKIELQEYMEKFVSKHVSNNPENSFGYIGDSLPYHMTEAAFSTLLAVKNVNDTLRADNIIRE